MALTVGVNSYVDLIYAEAYATERDGTDTWLALDTEEKERTLVSATDGLDLLDWVGMASESPIVLAWPRTATYYDPKAGYYIELVAETPEAIKEAQTEWAIDIGTNGGFTGEDAGGSSSSSGTPDEIKVGSIELKGLSGVQVSTGAYTVGKIDVPPVVMNLIDHLLVANNCSTCGGIGKPVWRAW